MTKDRAKVGVKGRRRQAQYTLEELLARCKGKGRRTKEEREWQRAKPVGRELI